MRANLLLCLAVFCLGFVPTVQGQDTLTVMSYNIYHAENPKTSESTIRDIANFIRNVQPDFVALQEVDDRTNRLAEINGRRRFSLTDSLAQLAGMAGYFGKALNFDSGGYGITILSRNKFESHKIDLPNSRQGESRVMLYLEAETPSGIEFLLANTHLDHQHQENRLAQVEKLNKVLQTSGKHVILAGDFNFTPGSREYKLMQSKWIDVATNSRAKATYPTENPTKKIDYIFLSQKSDWKIIDFQTYNISYSDHLPVVAKVVLDQR